MNFTKITFMVGSILFISATMISTVVTTYVQDIATIIAKDALKIFEFKSLLAFLIKTNQSSLFSPICQEINLHTQVICTNDHSRQFSYARYILERICAFSNSKDEKFHIANNVYWPFPVTVTNSDFDHVFLMELYNMEDSAGVFNKHKEWIDSVTKGNINSSLTEDLFELGRRFVCSVVYFDDLWEKKFDVRDTKNGVFKLRNGEEKPRQYMSTYGSFKIKKCTFNGCEFQVIAIPYENREGENGKRYMIYLLPDNHTVISKDLWQAFFESCNGDVSDQLSKMPAENIYLSIPRIEKITANLDLAELFLGEPAECMPTMRNSTMKTCLKIIEGVQECNESPQRATISNSLPAASHVIVNVPYIAFIYDISKNRIFFVFKDEGAV